MRGDGRGIFENIGGALQILGALLTPFLRRRRERWGAEESELGRLWPGDELVPRPRWQYLQGVTVAADASAVWPWVAQVGQGRGGFYSFERLENLVGCRIRNAAAILPEHQDPAAVGSICLADGAPPLRVAWVEAGRALVLHGGDAPGSAPPGGAEPSGSPVKVSWAFYVEPMAAAGCRLLARYRVQHGPGLALALAFGPWMAGPIACVMQRKMLRGIKQRAERSG